MDINAFNQNKTGELVKVIIDGSKDWSFIPHPLPKRIDLPEDIGELLIEARENLARLDGMGRHINDYQLLLRPLQQREALKSSSLEGTYATPEQLLLFEIEQADVKSESKKEKVDSTKEVFNYSNAIRLGQELLNKIPISLRFLKELHKELLTGVRGHQANPGYFRNTQVHIGSEKRFIPPPPKEAERLLYDLEKCIHEENEIDPLIFCFLVHYQFEAIHPFKDGNGRVGRLLMSLMIYQWLNLTNPWLYLSAYFDRYKDEYIDKLFNISAKGDWASWVRFCLKATIYQTKDSIQRFDKLIALRQSYSKRLSECGGSARLHDILEKIIQVPAITIPEVAQRFDISYPTAKRDIETLCQSQILVKSDIQNRPVLFIAPEIILTAYGDIEDQEKENS